VTKTTPPIKLPIPPERQCQILLRNRLKCTNKSWAIMTRMDKTTLRLCQNHARRMKDQFNAYPDIFQSVRFSVIHK
jgi:hypothetical protein